MCDQVVSDIPLPSGWAENVKSGVLHAISLAQYAMVAARDWAANSLNARVRLAVSVDHFSRRVVGVAVFKKQPTSVQIRTVLGRLCAKAKPKYTICDKGSQFWCHGFKAWCKRSGIKPRFGAVGQYGSIAVLERFVRTLKE